MRNLNESPASARLLVKHPVPWQYVSLAGNSHAAIVDSKGRNVVTAAQVSDVVFDAIWAMYCDHLLFPGQQYVLAETPDETTAQAVAG